MGSLIRRLALGTLGGLVLLTACTDAVGPNANEARLVVQPRFAEMTIGSQAEDPARLVDNIRILIRTLSGAVAVDQVAQWPVDQDTLRLDVVVEVTGTQSFDLEIQGRIGDEVMFRAGPHRLQLTGGASAPAQVSPVLEFDGPEASVAAVEIQGAPDEFMAGSTVTLSALATLPDGSHLTDPLMEWTSTDPEAASVSSDGVVQVHHDADRTVTITGRVAYTEVAATVSGPIRPTAIQVTAESTEVTAIGDEIEIHATLIGADSAAVTGGAIAWESRSPEILQLAEGSEGPVAQAQAVNNGEAWVVAEAGPLSDSLLIRVHQLPARVVITTTADTLHRGETAQLTAEVLDRNDNPIAESEVTWSSSEPAVASVDESGLVTAGDDGDAWITATSGEATGSILITVVPDEIIFGSSVLYFTDSTAGTDRVLAGLVELAEEGLIELTIATQGNRDDLLARMADDPDIVVYFNQGNHLRVIDEEALVAWVESGERLIYSDWTRNATVFAALETSAGQGTNETELTFIDERLAEGVQQPMPLTNPGWITFSTGMLPVGDAVSVCSFPSGESCLVYGNQGRTVTVGFLNDTVTEEDGRNFGRNLLRIVVQGETVAVRAPMDSQSPRFTPAARSELAPRDGESLPLTNLLPAARSGVRR